MLSDRNVIINMAIEHCDGEGDYLLCPADSCVVGVDDD